jgi:hypothetical protein
LTFRALYILIILAVALLPLNARGAEIILAKDEVGQLWIQIIGRIDEGDDLKFKSIIVDAIHRGEQITNIATFSQGGADASRYKYRKKYSYDVSADCCAVFSAISKAAYLLR